MKGVASVGVILTFWLILALPLILFGFPYPTDDGDFHEMWLRHFSAQFWAGDVYPRWLMDMNAGFGSPTFFFYPPVPFYAASFLDPVFGHGQHAWRTLGAAAALGLLISGFACYLWLSGVCSNRAAVLGSLLYLATPYHLAVDLHARGAFAEFWAFAWLPLILRFTQAVSIRQRNAVVGLATSYALLIMTHLPTVLMFSPVIPAYALLTAPPGTRLRGVASSMAGVALGIGLAAVYLFPALLTQDNINMQAMRTGHFDYDNNYLLPLPPAGSFRERLLWLGVGVLVTAETLFLVSSRIGRSMHSGTLFWFVICLCSCLMMTAVGKAVYLAFPPLQLIQFPWRFHVVLALASTGVAALCCSTMESRVRTAVLPIGFGLLLLCAVGSVGLIHPGAFQVPLSDRHVSARQQIQLDASEYIPKWANSSGWSGIQNQEAEADDSWKARAVAGQGEMDVSVWKPGRLTLATRHSEPITVDIHQFYYPNWTIVPKEQDGLRLEPSPEGLIRLSISPGVHTIHLKLGMKVTESIGTTISILILASLLASAAFRARVAVAPK